MCVPSNLVTFVAVVFLVYFGNVTSRPFDGDVPVGGTTGDSVKHHGTAAPTVPMSTEMAKQVWMMSNKSWNLNLCESGIRLKMGKKTLNKKTFFCSKKNAMKLAPMLFGEGLEDRVYVWCRMAALYSSVDNSSTSKSFEVKRLMYFEGDIVLTRESVDEILASYFPTPELQRASLSAARGYRKQNSARRQKRKISFKPWLWPHGILQYHIDDAFSLATRENIKEALSEYELTTCIRFFPVHANMESRVIKFIPGSFCSSPIGRERSGKATLIHLGPGCENFGIITHEIGHALGLHHEQARSDRDLYVTVLADNVISGFKGNFRKKLFFTTSHGVPYDYSSVMHYGTFDFGGDKMTIRTNDPEMQQVIGQRVSLSFLDVKVLNIAYCSNICGPGDLEWTECQNGGYRNPNNCASCVCPQGFAPPFCEEPSEGFNTAYTRFGGKSRLDNDRVDVDCGSQTLLATKQEQVLTSPGFDTDNGFGNNAYCPWLIKASTPGKRVHLMFVGKFHFYLDPKVTVCEERVEVKYKDLSFPGPRHCGHNTPKTTYRSHGSELLVTGQTLNYTTDWQGFQAIYTEENCGGCSEDSTNREPVCFRTVKYDCPLRPCGFCKPIPNTCYRDEEYCCDGFNQADDLCIREGTISNIKPPTSNAEATTPTVKSPNTAKPTTSTAKATASTMKPTTSTTEPTTSTTKPVTCTATPTTTTTSTTSTTPTAKPSTSTAKPTTSTAKLITPTVEPTTSTAKPTTSTTMPTTSTAKPTTSTAKPTTSTTKPITSTTESTSTAKPTTSTTKPTTSTTEPTASTAKPKMPTTKPTTSTTEPITSTAKPTTATALPTTSTAKPTTSIPQPTTSTHISTRRVMPTQPTTRPSVRFRPTNLWFRWSDWSACSATCGLCGVRTRRRSCFRGPCSGPAEEKEICGTPVCMEETIVESYKCKKTKKNCAGGWFTNNKCQVDSTCTVKKMIPMCCHGEADNRQCKIFFAAKRGN